MKEEGRKEHTKLSVLDSFVTICFEREKDNQTEQSGQILSET